MFPNSSLEELTSDEVYKFESTKPIYFALLKYFSDLYDYPFMQERWSQADPEERSGRMWWFMNEGWRTYSEVNPDLPIAWLATAKRALYWDHVPSNFHPWALTILEKFDLPRYQSVYKLPAEEYEAIARDLPVVLQGLRDYPHDKLAPPIDETNWGYSDQ